MKTLIIITTILVTLLVTSTAHAKNTQPTTNNRPNIATIEGQPKSQKPEDPTSNGTPSQKFENSIQKLERVQERISNPEIGEQIQETARNQEQQQIKIEAKLQEMNARPGYLKFILGPDYKNAGEIRSSIANLQNQERQLTKIKDSLSDEEMQEMDEIILTVQEEIDQYEQQLKDSLEGFSLFGWLNRLFTNYQ